MFFNDKGEPDSEKTKCLGLCGQWIKAGDEMVPVVVARVETRE